MVLVLQKRTAPLLAQSTCTCCTLVPVAASSDQINCAHRCQAEWHHEHGKIMAGSVITEVVTGWCAWWKRGRRRMTAIPGRSRTAVCRRGALCCA